jgi:hypothetical protein
MTPRPLAAIAVSCYVVHAAVLLGRGQPYDLLWGCHLAVLLIAAGLLRRNAMLNAVGLLWSCFGLPLWLLYSFTGGEFMATAALTHVGGLVIGIQGVRLLGCPRGAAWTALAGYVGLWAMTRAFTPAAANVNLAFHVHPGWEQRFSSYPIYFATLFTGGAITFLFWEQTFRMFPRQREAVV